MAWTLCVEVTFYILLPFYGAALARLAARWRVDRIRLEVIVLTGLAVASLALRAIDLSGSSSVLTASILENFDWFALGMLLAVLSVALQDGRRVPAVIEAVRHRPAMCWLGALGLYLLVAAVVHYPVVPSGPLLRELPFRGMVRHIAFGVIAVLIVLPAAVSPAAGGSGARAQLAPARLARAHLLRHLPVAQPARRQADRRRRAGLVVTMTFVVLSVVTIAWAVAAAGVSYYVIERPFLKFKNVRFRRGERRIERVTPNRPRGLQPSRRSGTPEGNDSPNRVRPAGSGAKRPVRGSRAPQSIGAACFGEIFPSGACRAALGRSGSLSVALGRSRSLSVALDAPFCRTARLLNRRGLLVRGLGLVRGVVAGIVTRTVDRPRPRGYPAAAAAFVRRAGRGRR